MLEYRNPKIWPPGCVRGVVGKLLRGRAKLTIAATEVRLQIVAGRNLSRSGAVSAAAPRSIGHLNLSQPLALPSAVCGIVPSQYNRDQQRPHASSSTAIMTSEALTTTVTLSLALMPVHRPTHW